MRGIPSLSGAIVHEGGGAAAAEGGEGADKRTSSAAEPGASSPSSSSAADDGDGGGGAALTSGRNDTITRAALPPLADAATASFQSSGRRHWRVGACSAREGSGLLENFDWLIGDIGSRIFMFD